MTYNVFGGTLNIAQLNSTPESWLFFSTVCCLLQVFRIVFNIMLQ